MELYVGFTKSTYIPDKTIIRFSSSLTDKNISALKYRFIGHSGFNEALELYNKGWRADMEFEYMDNAGKIKVIMKDIGVIHTTMRNIDTKSATIKTWSWKELITFIIIALQVNTYNSLCVRLPVYSPWVILPEVKDRSYYWELELIRENTHEQKYLKTFIRHRERGNPNWCPEEIPYWDFAHMLKLLWMDSVC